MSAECPVPPAPAALLKAARRLLRPLVRLMIRSGVTFPLLADLLRTLFIEVAAELLTGREARTDSRISLLTGVHRKEIRRLRLEPPDRDPVPAVVTVSSQIIARWLGVAAFVDADGRPKPLPRLSGAGGPSFEDLIGSVTTDIRPRAVLDDWLSQGLVSLDPEDRVRLNVAAFVPRVGGEEQLFYFARNLHDHLAAAVANVSADGAPPFLDRSVHYDRLAPSQAARLEQAAREGAMRVLLEVNRLALDLVETGTPPADPPDGPATRRFNFGIYIYTQDDPAPAA